MSCEGCQSCNNKCKTDSNGLISTLLPISMLFLGLTEDCNSRCRYCFVHQNPAQMPFETAFDGVNWLGQQSKQGQLTINYFGGEPLLRWHDVIVPITLYAKKIYGNRINFGITTNAILLDEEKLEFMKKYSIGMLLSFDGCKECQDYNRPLPNGKSSFDLISPKIPMILKYFPNMTMRMTLHKPTVHTFYENHKYALDMGFNNTFVAINTFDDWSDADFKVLEKQLYKVADLYITLIKQGKVMNFNPLIRQFDKVKAIRNGNSRTTNARNFGYGKCGIGANGSVVLSTNGELYTCQETYTNAEIRDFFHVGNLKSGVSNSRRYEIVSTFDPIKLRSADGVSCHNCKIKQICDGGCLVRNYTHNKDFNIVPTCFCKYENLMYDVCLYIEDILKNNELFQKTIFKKDGGQ